MSLACRVSAALVVLLAVAASPAAAKEPAWRDYGPTASPVVGTNETVAYLAGGPNVDVIRGAGPPRRFMAPDGCTDVRAAGGGRVLLGCPPYYGPKPGRYVVVNANGGDTSTVPTNEFYMRPSGGGESAVFYAIGASWIAGGYAGYRVSDDIFTQWHTGDWHWGSRDPYGPDRRIDLDARYGSRSLCAPLKRTPNPADDPDLYTVVPKYLPIVAAGRWALEGESGIDVLEGHLRLLRCGHGLLRDILYGWEARLADGYLVYRAERGVVSALRLRDLHEFTLPRDDIQRFVVADGRIWATTPAKGGGYRLLVARLPK